MSTVGIFLLLLVLFVVLLRWYTRPRKADGGAQAADAAASNSTVHARPGDPDRDLDAHPDGADGGTTAGAGAGIGNGSNSSNGGNSSDKSSDGD